MEIHVLELGAGHCSILRHDNGGVSVVDICNEKIKGLCRPLDYLSLIGVQHVSRFILSKSSQSRIDGLKELFDRFAVRNFWHSNMLLPTPVFQNGKSAEDFKCYLDVLMGKIPTCKEIVATAGYTSHLCNIEVLSPTAGMVHQERLGINDKALILLVTTSSGQRILLAGDIGFEAWRYMFADDGIRSKLRNLDVLLAFGEIPLSDRQILSVLSPRLVVSRNCNMRQPLETIGILTDGSSSVIIEDDDRALNVYTMSHSYAQRLSSTLHPEKHPRYEAWLVMKLYNRFP